MPRTAVRLCTLARAVALGAFGIGTATGAPIRVMSFNIRYGTAPDGLHAWTNRQELLIETIRTADPDLLGTQETLAFQRDALATALPEHEPFGAGRDDGGDRGEMCAVFVRRTRFERLAGGHFWLSETPEVPGSRSWDSSLPRMVTWVRLRDRLDPLAPPLLFCNTHFDHRGARARLESARRLREFVEREGRGLRVIVTGDFNAGEDDPPYAALFGDTAAAPSPLVDVYRAAHPVRQPDEGTFNGFRPDQVAGPRIDWIAASRGARVLEAQIVRRSQRGRVPSDHWPVVAQIAFSEAAPTSPPSESPDRRDARMRWWREARFGLFVHWGLYSALAGTWEGRPVGTRGGMEWIQQRVKADTETYARAAIPKFRPAPAFAREWARLAREAGCRYVVFTTKHHDGFALHDSAVSGFDAGSVLGRDLVREIVDTLRAEGLRVGFYHSVIDWHHDQYEYARSAQLPHPLKGRPYPNGARDHRRYVEYLHAQVRELLTNYGTVDVLWWDYSAQDFQGDEAWGASELLAMARALQPAIIMNNRLYRSAEAGWTGMGTDAVAPRLDPKFGDFLTPEQHIPPGGLPDVDWETCMTMNTTWGYSEHDHAWKPADELIRNLVDIASKGGNYLLNIGPRADGSVPEQSVAALRAIGDWLRAHGEAIYATDRSPWPPPRWGRITRRDTTLYLHVFQRPADGRLPLPAPVAFDCAVVLGAPPRPLTDRAPVPVAELVLPLELVPAPVAVIRLDRARW
ncbi:MAG: alpha-L-fucosidase [Kiritimatiellae bacterium]|nr:alpha-L-fucosidase [Kiritimatiellia bacterium]